MTRKDQLTMKPDKQTKGRGRGRGRGRGGRGRGKSEETGNPKKRNQRSGQSDPYDENWWLDQWESDYGKHGEEWGHEGWGGKEYYWDNYGWWEAQSALHQLTSNDEVEDNKQKPKNAKKAKKAETTAKETTAKTKKSKVSKEEAPSTKASKAAKTTESDSSRPKRKAKDQEEECPPAKATKSTKKKQDAQQVSDSEKATLTRQIAKYHNKYKDNTCKLMKDGEEKEEMKSKLKLDRFQECRLNIYWKLGTCGVTSKSKKKDIAHFSFPDLTDKSYMSRLSVCLVCASIFVTWTIQCCNRVSPILM